MGSEYGQMGRAVCGLIEWLAWSLLLVIPLALWKVIDIIVWVCHHVTVGVTP